MVPNMKNLRRSSLFWLLVCTGISVLWGFAAGNSVHGGTLDFQGVYYGTRCLLEHCDPYNEAALEQVYRADGGESPSETLQHRRTVTLYVNLPTTFLFIAPFALLPWSPAHLLWAALIIALIFIAALCMCDLSTRHAPGTAVLLCCILLVNCEVLFGTANTAGVVIGLCVFAVWCFINNRYVVLGILCLAVSLAIKPHDVGFVWLYLLLAGGVQRKRALQALAVTAVTAVIALLWLSHVAPHWLPEMRSNLAEITAQGGLNEPGPSSKTGRTASMVIDLQAAVSVFEDDPRVYNPVSYAASGALLVILCGAILRSPDPARNEWFALAAISALSMLVTYHRPYDAKLLLLSIPACAVLWAEGGLTGWLAVFLTSAGILLTGDIPLAILLEIAKTLDANPDTFSGKLLTVALTRPASVILLVLAVFYLCVYLRRVFGSDAADDHLPAEKTPAPSLAP
jgi:hypothetical protein